MKRTKILSALIALAALALCAAAEAEVVITNSERDGYADLQAVYAKFELPKGMLRSSRFDGFESPDRNIEIVAALLRAPYPSIAENVNADTLKMRGVEVLSRTEISVNGHSGILIKAIHQDEGTKWAKWIMVLENGDGTLVVNGVFVSGDADAAVAVESVMKSVIPYGVKSVEGPSEEEAMTIHAPTSGDKE